MQLKDIKKEGIFTTLYYELTWKIGWEQLLSILNVVIRTDFQEKGFQSLAVGMIAGTSPQDVTRDVLANGGDIRRSAFAKGESGYAVLTGYSHLMKVTMRIIVWNQSDRFILQLADDRAIDKDGKHSYDKYADSIEILAHIDYAKNSLRLFLGHADRPRPAAIRISFCCGAIKTGIMITSQPTLWAEQAASCFEKPVCVHCMERGTS